MRFAILGISHETNTFSRVPTDYGQFEASDILRGQEIVDRFEGSLLHDRGLPAGRARARLRGRPTDVRADRAARDDHRDAYDRLPTRCSACSGTRDRGTASSSQTTALRCRSNSLTWMRLRRAGPRDRRT